MELTTNWLLPMEHELKISPQYFGEVLSGNKTFELRKDDRNYKIGDTLKLLEFEAGIYTGRECKRTIVYILRDAEQYGLKEGFAILAIKEKKNNLTFRVKACYKRIAVLGL